MLSDKQLSHLNELEAALSQLLEAEQELSRADILKELTYYQNQLTAKPFRGCSNQLDKLIRDPHQGLHQVIKQKGWLEIDIKRLALLIKTYNRSIAFSPIHTTAQTTAEKNNFFERNKYLLERVLRPLMIRHQRFYSLIHPTTKYQNPLPNTYAQLRDLFFRNWIKGYFLAQEEVEKAFSYYWNKVDLKSEENWHIFFCTIEKYISWLRDQFNLETAQKASDVPALKKLKAKETKVFRASCYLSKIIEKKRKLAAGEDRLKELAEKVKHCKSNMKNTLSVHDWIIQSYRFKNKSKVKLQEITSKLQSEQEELEKVSDAVQSKREELEKVSAALQFTQEALKNALTALQSKQEELGKVSAAVQFTQEALDHAKAAPQSSSEIHQPSVQVSHYFGDAPNSTPVYAHENNATTLYPSRPAVEHHHDLMTPYVSYFAPHACLFGAPWFPASTESETRYQPSVSDNHPEVTSSTPKKRKCNSSEQGLHRFFTSMSHRDELTPLSSSLRFSPK